MSDDIRKTNRHLSDISHLFLDSIRLKQTGASPRPTRTPPGGARAAENELSAAEAAEFEPAPGDMADEEPSSYVPPVTAIVAAHLNGRQFEQAKRYARHLAAAGERIGLIEIDVSELRLMSFDAGGEAGGEEPVEVPFFDTRAMADALTELSCDVDRWLLLASNPRLPEARALLRETPRWVLLTTCDHDGIVGAYRTLKGLADLPRPELSVALLDAPSTAEAEQVERKLSGVCAQFLGWESTGAAHVEAAPGVAEHVAMCCRAMKDKAQLANAPHWQVVADLLAQAKATAGAEPERRVSPKAAEPVVVAPATAAVAQVAAEAAAPVSFSSQRRSIPMTSDVAALPAATTGAGDEAEVIELPAGEMTEASIIGAVLGQAPGEMIECPLRAPACPEARVAVTRDNRLTLVAVARQGLSEIGAIARAYRWLTENRQLVAMALPQFAIDAMRAPHLRLLVAQADASADLLQPMLQAGTVRVQTYRRLRWGTRAGLLLEAA